MANILIISNKNERDRGFSEDGVTNVLWAEADACYNVSGTF